MNEGIVRLTLGAGILIVSYLVGNISPAIILGRIYGVDIRKEGSGNAGTTNVLRTIGKKAGAVTFIVDVAKGFLPAFFAGHFVGAIFGMACGTMVVLGHMWPALYQLRGGKGVATTFGVLLALQPLLALALIGMVILVVLICRMVSVGVCLAALCAAPAGLLYGIEYAVWLLVIALLIIVKHIANIRRVFSGEEKKLSFGNRDKQKRQK
jgi:glycerol-3-phosphate acyltransferase PlsY